MKRAESNKSEAGQRNPPLGLARKGPWNMARHQPPPPTGGGWDVPAQPFSSSWRGKAESERTNGRWCSLCSSIVVGFFGGSTDSPVTEPYFVLFCG